MGVPVAEVKNVIIWGNHSSTQYPDVNHGTVNGQPCARAEHLLSFTYLIAVRGACLRCTWCDRQAHPQGSG